MTDLVERDLAGEDPNRLADDLESYEEFLQGRFELNLLLYRSPYPLLGSYRLFRHKWDLDITAYYDLWLSSFRLDEHLDPRGLRTLRAERPFVSGALEQFNRIFEQECQAALADGSYFDDNAGRFVDGLDTVDFVKDVGQHRTPDAIRAILLESFRRVRRALMPEIPIDDEALQPSLQDFVDGGALRSR